MNTKKIQTEIKEKVVINSPYAFEQWEKSLHGFNSERSFKNYVFSIPEFSFCENLNLSTQVDYYNSACGCKTGSFLMSLTFVVTLCNFFISGGSFSEITFYNVLSLIGITLSGAFTGKIIGLLYAHWSLIKIARSIRTRLTDIYSMKQLT